MPKVDIWSRLTPQSQAAVAKSREQYAAFKTRSTDALVVMREGYNPPPSVPWPTTRCATIRWYWRSS